MPIPQAPQELLDLLSSADIINLPAQISAGEVITPRLTLEQSALDALAQVKELASIDLSKIDLEVSLNDVTSTLRPVAPNTSFLGVDLEPKVQEGQQSLGTSDLKVVFKEVEHIDTGPPGLDPAQIIADTPPAGKLPYVNPQQFNSATSTLPGYVTYTQLRDKVKGMVGKIAGLTGHFTKLEGKLVFPGDLTGTLKTRVKTAVAQGAQEGGKYLPIVRKALLDKTPHLQVTWTVEGENGEALQVGEHFLLLNNTTLTSLAPALVFLPLFVEYDPAANNLGQRRISCYLQIFERKPTSTDPKPRVLADRLLGPKTLTIPKVQIPTVLALTEHAVGRPDFPGSVLLIVPEFSEVRNPDDMLMQFHGVHSVLAALSASLRSHGIPPDNPLLVNINSVLDNIGLLLDFLNPSRESWRTFRRASSIMDIWWVPRRVGIPVPWYFSWEDVISAVFLFGPRGRAVLCHNAKELAFREGKHQGVFQVTVGSMPVAVVSDLSAPPYDGATIPVLGRFKIHVTSRLFEGFNDTISSLQIVSTS